MKHSELARENLRRARHGGEDVSQHPGLEWRITMSFYAALHAVDHALAAGGARPHDHDQRRQRIFVDPRWKDTLSPIRADYRALERLSRQARYMPDAHPMTTGEFREAILRAERVLRQLGVPTS